MLQLKGLCYPTWQCWKPPAFSLTVPLFMVHWDDSSWWFKTQPRQDLLRKDIPALHHPQAGLGAFASYPPEHWYKIQALDRAPAKVIYVSLFHWDMVKIAINVCRTWRTSGSKRNTDWIDSYSLRIKRRSLHLLSPYACLTVERIPFHI